MISIPKLLTHFPRNRQPAVEALRVVLAGMGVFEDHLHHAAVFLCDRDGVTEIRADGGAAVSNFLAQFQADVAGVEVYRPRMQETTALGAAYLAGLGIGFWKSGQEIEALQEVGQRFVPCMGTAEREAFRRGWARALERAKGWITVDGKS